METEPTSSPVNPPSAALRPGSFGDDVSFLSKHTQLVVLASQDGQARVAVAPAYQGRVMTSSARGDQGTSFGWIHRPVIEKGERQPHMTVLGGEDRFWLGPEGGQFGLYFAAGAPFEFAYWQVPEAIDWGGWDIVSEGPSEVVFETSMEVINHSGTRFSLSVRRAVRLLEYNTVVEHLGVDAGAGASLVGYESDNAITNTGTEAWSHETGLLSIWILGMFTPSDETTVVIPIRQGDDASLGPAVKDDYFGNVPEERLRVQSRAAFFRGDGRKRGKIGIPRPRALPVAGSYDAARSVLTIVQFTLPTDAVDYVDSRWAKQAEPYRGDVINSYNDGPPEPGAEPLGPFYEIESSSPAKPLAPGETLRHVHRTVHVVGDKAALDAIARAQLGVGVSEIAAAL